jgi:hypothetical protein
MTNPGSNARRIVALNRDVFFGVRLKQLGRELGYEVEIAPDAEAFLELLGTTKTDLGIIDVNALPDWNIIAGGIGRVSTPPILAFGPHLDVEGLRAAKAAGVTRVVSNGTFHREAASLIARYAVGETSERESEDGQEIDDH